VEEEVEAAQVQEVDLDLMIKKRKKEVKIFSLI